MPPLAPRDRRALALGALLALAVVGWPLVGAPLAHAETERRARLASSRDLLARELEIVASADAYPPLVGNAERAMRAATPRLLAGGTPGARSASLVAWLQGRAREAGVRLTEIAPLDDAASGAVLRPVSIRVAGQADLGATLSFISSIERGDKLVRVSSLRLSAEAETGAEALHFDLTATGYGLGDWGADGVVNGAAAGTR